MLPADRRARAQTCSLLFALVASGCSGSSGVQSSPTPLDLTTPTDGAPMAPGDMVRVGFWREANLNGDYAVESSGEVILPILGARSVAGKPADEVRRALLSEYSGQLRNQEVSVTTLRRVRVLGYVRQPGLYYVDATMSVADAIALAGGVDVEGDVRDIRLLRDGTVIRPDLDQSVRLGSAGIRSSDQIEVGQRGWLSRNTAAVIGSAVAATAIIISALIQN
jgi:polysaccharide export outer membrane protein